MMALTFSQKENIGLQYVLDALHPCSPYGRALLRDLSPMGPGEKDTLQRQLGNIGRVLACREDCRKTLDQLLHILMGLRMIRPTVEKCREADLNEIELFEMKRFLLQCQQISSLFAQIQPIMQLDGIALQDTGKALDILDPEGSRVASFHIPDTASETLAALRREKRALQTQWEYAPAPSLLSRRAEIAALEEQETQRIHKQLTLQLRPYIPAILANMDAIADLDLTVEKARIARQYGGVAPELTDRELEFTDMTNPRIADLLKNQGKAFTGISISLQPGAAVITGANMGGKSVALKTLALNILLVHCGFFPFARAARLPLFDGLHIISEVLESIDRGLSSFGGEMARFSHTVQQLGTGFHFLVLDEFARGTNPQEGAAIVRAVTRYLNRCNAIAVLATHYDDVAPWATTHYQVAGLRDLNWEVLGHEIATLGSEAGAARIGEYMNYGLVRVDGSTACPRDALNICRLLGMPAEIVEDAEKAVSSAPDFC